MKREMLGSEYMECISPVVGLGEGQCPSSPRLGLCGSAFAVAATALAGLAAKGELWLWVTSIIASAMPGASLSFTLTFVRESLRGSALLSCLFVLGPSLISVGNSLLVV